MKYAINIRETPYKEVELLRDLIEEKTEPIRKEIQRNDPEGDYQFNVYDGGGFLRGGIFIEKLESRRLIKILKKKTRIASLIVDWDDIAMMGDCKGCVLRRSRRPEILPQEKLDELTKDFYNWFFLDQNFLNHPVNIVYGKKYHTKRWGNQKMKEMENSFQ